MNKDNEENIKIFEGIGTHKVLSRYSGELNRVFKDKSFEKFFSDLVANKTFKSNEQNEILSNEDKHKRFNTFNEPRHFNLKSYRKFLKELIIEEEKEKEKLKTYKNQFKITKEEDKLTLYNKQMKRKKIVDDRINFHYPDMGKYNPNFTSIRKKMPIISLSKYQFNPNKKYPIVGRDLFPIKNNYSSSLDYENENDTSIKLSKTYDSSKQKKFSGRNQTLKFDYYTSRKPLVPESITKNIPDLEVSSSCSPKNIKGLIEFNKMSTDIENTKFIPDPERIKYANPPLGMYKPKYLNLEKNIRDIYIKRYPIINKNMKVKKLMYSYHVPKEYELFDKLN